jgi:hypothetical protein
VTAGAGIRPPARAAEADIQPQVLGAEAVDRRMVAEVGRRTAAVVPRRMAMAVAAGTEDKRLIRFAYAGDLNRDGHYARLFFLVQHFLRSAVLVNKVEPRRAQRLEPAPKRIPRGEPFFRQAPAHDEVHRENWHSPNGKSGRWRGGRFLGSKALPPRGALAAGGQRQLLCALRNFPYPRTVTQITDASPAVW